MQLASSERIFADTSSGSISWGPHRTVTCWPILRLIDSMGPGLRPRRIRAARPTRSSPALSSQATADGTVEEVRYRAGDLVEEGAELIVLDTAG